MKRPPIHTQTVRQIAALVRSEAYTLGEATEELERRKRLGAKLDADEQPPVTHRPSEVQR